MVYRILGKSMMLMALFGFCSIPLVAQDDKAEETKDDEEKATVASVMADYTKQYSEYMKAYREEEDAAKQRLLRSTQPRKDDFAKQMFELIEADPSSADSLKALTWLQQGVRNPRTRKKVVDLLLEHHIESDQIAAIAPGVARGRPSKETEDTLKRIIEKSPHVVVKGRTSYALLNYYSNIKRYAGDESIMESLEKSPNKAFFEYLKGQDLKAVSAKVDELIESIQNEYKEVTLSDRSKMTLATKVKGIIFERDNLQVGMEVPEIEGEDVDGVEFKLSDYRGKVVFIDFWGDW